MNSWIILLLLCCCGKGNNCETDCGCHSHSHCHKHCVEPRVDVRNVCEREVVKEVCVEKKVEDCAPVKNECECEPPVWRPYNGGERHEEYCERDFHDTRERCDCGCKH